MAYGCDLSFPPSLSLSVWLSCVAVSSSSSSVSVEGVGGEVEEEGDVEDLMVTLVDPGTPIKEGEREDRCPMHCSTSRNENF